MLICPDRIFVSKLIDSLPIILTFEEGKNCKPLCCLRGLPLLFSGLGLMMGPGAYVRKKLPCPDASV